MAEVVKLGPKTIGSTDNYVNGVLGSIYEKRDLWGIATENELSDAWGVYDTREEAEQVLEDLEYSEWNCDCLPFGCCDYVEKAQAFLSLLRVAG